jgi:hypothetical protein
MIEKFKNRRTVVVAFIAGLAIVVALAADILWPTSAPVIPVGGTRTAADATKSADEAVAAAGMSPAERQATESLVKAYILENPEIINDAVAIFRAVFDRSES